MHPYVTSLILVPYGWIHDFHTLFFNSFEPLAPDILRSDQFGIHLLVRFKYCLQTQPIFKPRREFECQGLTKSDDKCTLALLW